MKNDFKHKTCKQLKNEIDQQRQLNLFNWVTHCHKVLSSDLEEYFGQEKWTEVDITNSVSEDIVQLCRKIRNFLMEL